MGVLNARLAKLFLGSVIIFTMAGATRNVLWRLGPATGNIPLIPIWLVWNAILPAKLAREGLRLTASLVLLLPIKSTTLASAIPLVALMVNMRMQELLTVCPAISAVSLAQVPLHALPAGLQSQEAIFTSMQGHVWWPVLTLSTQIHHQKPVLVVTDHATHVQVPQPQNVCPATVDPYSQQTIHA